MTMLKKDPIIKLLVLASLALGPFCAPVPAQEMFRGGIVYGPKAAFNIGAPDGWVLDNKSGVEQGLPCVLYPKGSSWSDAKTVMYAKIAGTEFEDVNAFVAMAIKEMEKVHGKPKEKIASGKTGDGRDYFINEYPATKTYSQWERVAYVQLPHAVAYVVLSSRDRASYQKDSPALQQALKTFTYLPYAVNPKVTGEEQAGQGSTPKKDAPKVIETDDMKLAMKASELETAGKHDEALKLYEQAIDRKGRFTPFVYHNRGMLYLRRAKVSQDRQSRIADLQRAIADFQTSIKLGAASNEELNKGLEKVATKGNLEEATKLLEKETQR
jgi:tetratricopeptide (TPR) repeat protein